MGVHRLAGDYLYDADTVAWLLEVLRRDAPRVALAAWPATQTGTAHRSGARRRAV